MATTGHHAPQVSTRQRKGQSQPPNALLSIDSLPSYNLELTQGLCDTRDTESEERRDKKYFTKVQLRGVPRFLIDAFNRINREGISTEGLFRKEGNTTRIRNSHSFFMCQESLSALSIHDVCSLVKRFLRDMKRPLIPVDSCREALFRLAEQFPDGGQINPSRITEIFDQIRVKGEYRYPLPLNHLGTLGFLMRQLHDLSAHSNSTQMSARNLATVFAPTIFREAINEPPKTPKLTKPQLVLQKSVEENEVRIAVLQLLIDNCMWIGVPSNFYLTSDETGVSSSNGSTRSNSFRQSTTQHIVMLGGPFVFHKCRSSQDSRRIAKRGSAKMMRAARVEERERTQRSQSSVRGFMGGVIDRIVPRRSMERKNTSSSRNQSPARVSLSTDRRGRSPPRPIRTLVVEDCPSLPPPSTTSVLSSLPSAPSSSSSTLPQRTNSLKATNTAIYTQIRKPALRDEPASLLGEDFLNPEHKERHTRVRRHTTPVKTGLALRRNQPNTVHSGLPVRRATMTMGEGKENVRVKRTTMTDDEDESSDLEDTLKADEVTLTDHTIIPNPHEKEYAQRRQNFKRKKVSGEGSMRGRVESRVGQVLADIPRDEEDRGDRTKGSRRTLTPPPIPVNSPTSEEENVRRERRREEEEEGTKREERRSGGERRRQSGETKPVLFKMPSLPPRPPPSSLSSSTSSSSTLPSLSTLSHTLSTPLSSFLSHSVLPPPRPVSLAIPSSSSSMASPIGRRVSTSASSIGSPQFKMPMAGRKQRSVGETDFAFSEQNRTMLLEANDAKDLRIHSQVGMRPSVVMIKERNRGRVANLVNMYTKDMLRAGGCDSADSSMRSSLGSSRNSLASVEGEPRKGSGPPVGHSITPTRGREWC